MKKYKLIFILALLISMVYFIFIAIISYKKTRSVDGEWIEVKNVDISNVTDDVIGYLSIPKFNNEYYIDMPIKDGTCLDILATSIGHFRNTPYQSGNICLVAHNSGINKREEYVGFFDKINTLSIGDLIIYNYLNNEYSYKVITNIIIKETDLSVLENTNDNRITLITCVKGRKNREYRQCVIAIREDLS